MVSKEIIKKIMKIKYENKGKFMVVLASGDIIEQLEKEGLATYKREMIFGYHYTICGLPAKKVMGISFIYVAHDLRFCD